MFVPISSSELIQLAQAKFQPAPAELNVLSNLLERLGELDHEDMLEGSSSLLFKAKRALDSLHSTTTDIAVRVQTAVADDILSVDLDRSASDISTGAAGGGINPTPLENAFGQLSESRWPSPITNTLRAADQQSPVWKIDSSNSRSPISIYEGIARSKTIPLHSQIFTLTSTYATLIRLPQYYLNKLKTNSLETNSNDSDRVGFLQYSVALSALFEFFKAAEKPFAAAARNQAKKQEILDKLFDDLSSISQFWDMYNEQFQRAATFKGLECQYELSAILRPLRQLLEAHGSNRMDKALCSEVFMSFLQHYNSFFGSNNASYGRKQTAMAARLHTAHTNKTTQVLLSNDMKEDTFYTEGSQAVEALRDKLKKTGKIVEGFDSFEVYGDNYVQLYQVYKARGWNIEVGWVGVVSACQNAYTKDGSTGDSARNLLDLVFTAAADREAEPVIANLAKLNFNERAEAERAKFDALFGIHEKRLNWDE